MVRGEADSPFLAVVFAGTAQHALAGQAGRVYRGLKRPGREVGGKGQGKRLTGCVLPGVFRAGMGAVRTKRATRPPEISLWEPP